MQSIFNIIKKYEDDFLYKPVKVVEGYSFDQSATLKQINLYSAGQFLDGDTDELGRKIFFDITTPMVRNFAKNIDLDTKDMNIRAEGKDFFKAWIYRRRARRWMRETGLATRLNLIPDEVVGMGTVVLKRVKSKEIFQMVDLRNLINDPSARYLKDGWTIEKLYFTVNELRMMVKSGWNQDEINRAVEDFTTNGKENYVGDAKGTQGEFGDAQYICVREFRGYVPKNMLSGDVEDTDTTPTLAYFAVMMPEDGDAKGSKKTKAKAPDREGLVFFKGPLKEMPYKELHLRRVKGRWLGRGLYEECFPVQETKNRQMNWLLDAMKLSQLIIFQTKNNTPLTNVLSELRNGQILKWAAGNEDELNRVDTRVTDLSSNNTIAQELRMLTANLTNAQEVTTGANLPSGTPFSLANLQNQNANKLFDQVRENYGNMFEEVFNEWVLPELEKEMTTKGVLEITDQEDLEFIKEQYTKAKVWDTVKKMLLLAKKPTNQEVDMITKFVTQQLTAKESISLDIEEGYLKFDKTIECKVTDESESPAMLTTLTTILQTVGQNPQIAGMPAFQLLLDKVGLTVNDVVPRALPAPPPEQAQPVAA